jgi:hypothetical protein
MAMAMAMDMAMDMGGVRSLAAWLPARLSGAPWRHLIMADITTIILTVIMGTIMRQATAIAGAVITATCTAIDAKDPASIRANKKAPQLSLTGQAALVRFAATRKLHRDPGMRR